MEKSGKLCSFLKMHDYYPYYYNYNYCKVWRYFFLLFMNFVTSIMIMMWVWDHVMWLVDMELWIKLISDTLTVC